MNVTIDKIKIYDKGWTVGGAAPAWTELFNIRVCPPGAEDLFLLFSVFCLQFVFCSVEVGRKDERATWTNVRSAETTWALQLLEMFPLSVSSVSNTRLHAPPHVGLQQPSSFINGKPLHNIQGVFSVSWGESQERAGCQFLFPPVTEVLVFSVLCLGRKCWLIPHIHQVVKA